MNFSTAKRTLLRPRKERWLSTFFIALATAAAFFIPYIIMGRGYLIFYGDFNAQQIPFYKMCHEAVRSGNFGWNWYTDLGANFIGSYTFYLLGSPFFWLTIPFPNNFVPYLMGPLLILKFAFAALTAYIYIRRLVKTPEAARLGALLYAFSGFSIYNIFFNHFHEAIIIFPLLLWGMEVLITENRRCIFALMVALCALTNYYFFFGMVIFCLIYFFVRVFSRAITVKFTRFLLLLLEAVLGVGIAAILLLPSFFTVIQNSRVSEVLIGWDALTYSNEQIYLNIIQSFFFPNDLPAIASFFPGTEREWSSLAGWLPVFGMMGVIAFFKARRGSWLKRIVVISGLFAFIPILNSSFSAFNSNYYARWFYMPLLLLCLMTASVCEDETVSFRSAFRWVCGITAGFIIAIGFIPRKVEDEWVIGLYTYSDDWSYKLCFWLFSGIAVACIFIMLVLLIVRRKGVNRFINAAVACVCIISVIYGNCYMAIGFMYSPKVKETMIDRLIEGDIDFSDDTNFRIDTYDCEDNLGMFMSTPSINTFHSVVPGSIMEYYAFLNYDRGVATRLDTSLPAVRSLLSVKYIVNPTNGESFLDYDGNPLLPGFKYVKTDGGYYIYENENYIPMGFCYDYYMTEDFCSAYSSSGKSRLMLKGVLLSEAQAKKYSDILYNLDDLEQDIFYGQDSPLDQEFETEPRPEQDADQDQGNEQIEDVPEELQSTQQAAKDDISLALTDTELERDAAALRDNSAHFFEIDNGGFTAKIKRDKKSLVFFSVPFEKGWSCTVNGMPAEIEKVNKGFMAVVVPEGESVIRFDYETPGLKLGMMISGGSAVILLIYFLISLIWLRKREIQNPYPEGDELIFKWQREDNYNPEDSDSNGIDISSHSLLDDISSIEDVSHPGEGFNGGFTINTDLFD